jgi:hypothetical protein
MKSVGDAFIEVLGRIHAGLHKGEQPPESWLYMLGPAARGLPASCIPAALAQLEPREEAHDSNKKWWLLLDLTREKLQLRQLLIRAMEE